MARPRFDALRTSGSALLLLLAQGAATAAPAPPPAAAGDTPSLQELLAGLRADRDRALEALRRDVDPILRRIEALAQEQRTHKAAGLREELVRLGIEAAPILAGAIDPGESPTPPIGFRAEQTAIALAELRSAAVTDAMIELARHGSKSGVRNALLVLGKSPEPRRAAPAIQEVFQSGDAELRQLALAALGELKSPAANTLFRIALGDEDDSVVEVALRALAENKNADVDAEVLGLLSGPRAGAHLAAVLAYYGALPELFDDTHVVTMLQALDSDAIPSAHRVSVLEALRARNVDISRHALEALEPLAESFSNDQREAALVLMARGKDKGALKDLLKPYDQEIARDKERSKPYAERAHIHYRVGDLRSAIRDYRKALDLNERTVSDVPYLGIARCYALMGKFKDAADYLDRAPITLPTLHALAKEPDFAEMVEDSRWRQAFHLPNEDR